MTSMLGLSDPKGFGNCTGFILRCGELAKTEFEGGVSILEDTRVAGQPYLLERSKQTATKCMFHGYEYLAKCVLFKAAFHCGKKLKSSGCNAWGWWSRKFFKTPTLTYPMWYVCLLYRIG